MTPSARAYGCVPAAARGAAALGAAGSGLLFGRLRRERRVVGPGSGVGTLRGRARRGLCRGGSARLRYRAVIWYTVSPAGDAARFDDGRGHVVEVPVRQIQATPVGVARWGPGLFAAAAVAVGARHNPIWPIFAALAVMAAVDTWLSPPGRRARRTVRVRGDGRAYRLFASRASGCPASRRQDFSPWPPNLFVR